MRDSVVEFTADLLWERESESERELLVDPLDDTFSDSEIEVDIL